MAAGVTPTPAEWRAFLDRMLLWLGAAALAAAAVFFVAANWDALGRFAKFALVEAAIVAAMVVTLWRGMDSLAGRAALFAAAMLIGVLLALVGQVYQTGADTYELFAAWALAILAWAVISRQPAVWILWLALINLAVASYYQTFGGFLGAIFSPPAALGMLFAINSVALIAWETLVARGVDWLDVRWAPRVLAVAGGTAITALAVLGIFEHWPTQAWYLLPYAMWLAVIHWVYRIRHVDMFILAGAVLSLVIVVSLGLGRELLDHGGAGGLLLIGLVLIATGSVGALWLRKVAAEERQ